MADMFSMNYADNFRQAEDQEKKSMPVTYNVFRYFYIDFNDYSHSNLLVRLEVIAAICLVLNMVFSIAMIISSPARPLPVVYQIIGFPLIMLIILAVPFFASAVDHIGIFIFRQHKGYLATFKANTVATIVSLYYLIGISFWYHMTMMVYASRSAGFSSFLSPPPVVSALLIFFFTLALCHAFLLKLSVMIKLHRMSLAFAARTLAVLPACCIIALLFLFVILYF